MASPGLQPHHASWPADGHPAGHRLNVLSAWLCSCLQDMAPGDGHHHLSDHQWGGATTAALLAFEEEIWELGTHALPGEILPGKCWHLCLGAELVYSHGLLPAQREWKPLSTGRAGLRDWWDSSYRQELPPLPRLPSLHLLPSLQLCIPSAASTGILCCDLGWGEVGSDAALSCLSSGGMLSPCPIPPSPDRGIKSILCCSTGRFPCQPRCHGNSPA